MTKERIFALFISITVAATILATIIGPLNTQKNLVYDQTISDALQTTESAIRKYESENQALPKDLNQVYEANADLRSQADGKVTYKYISSNEFELCGTFKTSSEKEAKADTSNSGASMNDMYPELSSYYESYDSHPKGEKCYKKTAYYGSGFGSQYDYLDTSYSSSSASQSSQSSFSESSKDTERQTDIKALHGQLEAFYAQTGGYPSLSELNNPQWRATNLKGLDSEALRDPNGTSGVIVASPTKGAYAYAATPANCSGADSTCTTYILTAYLSTGKTYTKKSLN